MLGVRHGCGVLAAFSSSYISRLGLAIPRAVRHRRISFLLNENVAQRDAELAALFQRLGYMPANGRLFVQALTHRSYQGGSMPHNDRLAFLGDKVLSAVVAEHLVHKFPHTELFMLDNMSTLFLSDQSLAARAVELGLHEFVLWQPTKPEESIPKRVLATTFEGIIGFVLEDGGHDASRVFVRRHILSRELSQEQLEGMARFKHARRVLDLLAREGFVGKIEYSILRKADKMKDGHDQFRIAAYAGQKFLAEGFGASVREARRNAASRALKDCFTAKDFGRLSKEHNLAEMTPQQQLDSLLVLTGRVDRSELRAASYIEKEKVVVGAYREDQLVAQAGGTNVEEAKNAAARVVLQMDGYKVVPPNVVGEGNSEGAS